VSTSGATIGAASFACNCRRHGGSEGALLKVIITFTNPTYVRFAYDQWQAEGYDACRTDATPLSSKMEWCVKRADQVDVLDVEPMQCSVCRLRFWS